MAIRRRISATEAAKRFADMLNEVEYRGESFTIERHGRPVAAVTPRTQPRGRAHIWREALAILLDGPRADPDLERDLAEVRRSVGPMPRDPWEPYSTPPS